MLYKHAIHMRHAYAHSYEQFPEIKHHMCVHASVRSPTDHTFHYRRGILFGLFAVTSLLANVISPPACVTLMFPIAFDLEYAKQEGKAEKAS
jgi:hypothetical protein